MIRRGVADTSYAAIASAALVAGLMLLSFSGGIFSLTGQAPGDPGGGGLDPDLQDVDLPNGSIDPGEYVDNETIDAATREDGIVTRLARGLFEFFSGQDIEPPDLPAVNGSGNRDPGEGMVGNGTLDGGEGVPSNESEGEGSGETNTTDGSGTGDTNVSDGDGSGTGGTQGGTNTSNGDGASETNVTEEPGEDGTGSGTAGNGSEGSGTEGQEPSMPGNESGSGGFMSGLLEQVSELLSGKTEDSGQENGAGQDGSEEGSDGGGDEGGGGGLPGIGAVRALLVPLLAIGGVVAGLLVYRSDRGWRELVSVLLSWARSAVRQLPDVARRVIVWAVSVVVSTLLAAGSVLWRFIHAPVTVARETREALALRLRVFQEVLAGMRERSVRETAALVLGGEAEAPEGLDRIWLELKEALGLTPDTSLTPLEIGREAIEQGFHAETIKEIVAALRAEKYAPEGYGDEMRIGRWEKALWGDGGG